MTLTFQQVMGLFGQRKKCFVDFKGHKADAKYLVTINSDPVAACGDHLTRAISEVLGNQPNGRIDVRVWVKP